MTEPFSSPERCREYMRNEIVYTRMITQAEMEWKNGPDQLYQKPINKEMLKPKK